VLELLADPAEYARCQAAALARVTQFYEEGAMLDAYRALYHAAWEA